MISDYEKIVTGRDKSIFAGDIVANENTLRESVRGSRIAIVGAAGSIGSAVARTILRFKPASLSLVDLNENNLVEVVRDLRSSTDVTLPEDFAELPIGLGTIEFDRYFQESKPFDYFLNLSAIKHVRSEKNIYCLMRMIDTNAVFLYDFLSQNPYHFRKVFSVSSDKAANPANMMGASKMVMEKVLLNQSEVQPFSTTRFANVAFSDGSLPYGFLQRVRKQQAISAPNDVKRYFISHQEAGEMCVLSCVLGKNRDVFFPKLARDKDEKTFSQIALDLLESLGYETVECDSEDEAKSRTNELIPKKKWPCYFSKSDTTGEKAYEEFYVEDEKLDMDRYRNIGVIKRDANVEEEPLKAFINFCREAKANSFVTKDDYVQAMRAIVPDLRHMETGNNLDNKM
ncbi:MAG: UDP-N-acetylglucosamine 4,6-dehydratase [Planctomycetes bacterium B3_Pla]|nr:MAG: UDP-N-acetylglucosamine 4,6-dehydratase [Planctomycetes bacterium B3_Pla]